MTDDPPNGWVWGIGEASRPLSEGGYYMHYATRMLPGSNQYEEKYLELMIDTIGMPPRQHYVEIGEYVENMQAGESREVRRIDHAYVDVEEPEDEESQQAAEEIAEEIARDFMAEHPALTTG